MSFLQSLFLAGLAAAAIPVLIHLLNRPRARLVPFSTLEFIRRLQTKRSKRIRVRDVLLLLLRVLLIVVVALAFARPALRGALAGGLGGRARTSACIVLDVSASMGYGDERETVLDEAKARARQVTDLFREGDEVFLILASDRADVRFDSPTHNFRLVETEIEKAMPTARGTDLALALAEAERLLESSRNPNREIYLITDAQRAGFPERSGEEDREGGAEEGRPRLFILPVGDENRPNRSVSGAELFEPRRFGETLKIRTEVANHSDEPAEALVTLNLDGERRGASSVSLGPGGHESLLFSILLKERGVRRGEIRIDGDRLARDDAFYFTLHRPERLDVLIVAPPDEKALIFLRNALDPEGGEGLIRVREADPGELRSLTLDPYHAVFLAGVPAPDEAAVANLAGYVERGGGVVIAPGDAVDFGSYNTVLLEKLVGAVRIGPSLVEHGERPAGVDRFDETHPLFSVFRQGLDQALRDLSVSRSLDLEAGEQAVAVASTSDGRPLLLEARRGAGRVFLWSIGFDLGWSDLPTHPVFLPLLHEMTRYLYSGGALHKTSIAVGKRFRKDLSGLSIGDEFLCVTPIDERTLQPRSEGDRLLLEFDQTDTPGFYTIEGGDLTEWFAVNIESAESDLASLAAGEIAGRFPEGAAEVIRPDRRLERPVLEARYGRELWWELIILALLIAAAELFLSRTGRPAAAPAE